MIKELGNKILLNLVAHFLKSVTYPNDPKFSDRQVRANSADQDQTAPKEDD